MTSTLLSHPDALVAHWRSSADDDNPAGPLFSDRYAEFDLTTSQVAAFTACSDCTQSRNMLCCR
jgi:hypothetical protein